MKAFLIAVFSLCLAFVHGQTKTTAEYFCAACGCKNDGKTFDQPGSCPVCNMKLQQVGTFNFQMTALSPGEEIIAFKTSRPDGIGRIIYKASSANTVVGEGSMPQVSPDKKWIVFERGNNQILLYNISKDTTIDVSPKLEGLQSPAWLGLDKLIFVAGKFPGLTLYQMDITGNNIEPLVKTPGMRYGCKA